jgi:Ca2+:H+ antiporter
MPQRTFLSKFSIDWFLVFVPLAFLFHYVPALHNQTALFIISGLGIIPLAGWMGRATEHLAVRMGEGIGGLLNATFGNAAELIIAIVALSRGYTEVVKASITGSIIGNILLVFGLSVFLGGIKYPQQKFNRTAASVSASSLLLAAMALMVPALFHYVADKTPGAWSPRLEHKISIAIAIMMLLVYVAMLWFSLKSHRYLFNPEHSTRQNHDGHWSRGKAIGVLVAATVLVAFLSEFLVGAIDHASQSLGLTQLFVGVIVVAIVGNAAEHSTAVWMAMKDRMDLSLGIALGSSLQIALFVAPVLVLLSGFIGQPLDLEFTVPEALAVLASVWLLAEICDDGESNWLEGLQLLALYVILGILFYFLPATF